MSINCDDVVVLLSTYNGERYLAEQLESILSQKFECNLTLIIRDDGSSDNTRNILLAHEKANQNIILSFGDNVGVVQSFFELLKMANETLHADFYFLCDQDDIWLPDKIKRACGMLRMQNGSCLYSSSLNVTDEHLQHKYVMKHSLAHSSYDAIYTNAVTGCTAAWNKHFQELIRIPDGSEEVLMHDWWLYLIAAFFGTHVYDERPSIMYRQHSANVVGAIGVFRRVMRFFSDGLLFKFLRWKQFLLLMQLYSDFACQDRELIKLNFLRGRGIRMRIRLLFFVARRLSKVSLVRSMSTK